MAQKSTEIVSFHKIFMPLGEMLVGYTVKRIYDTV